MGLKQYIFLYGSCCILIHISLRVIPSDQVKNNIAMVQIIMRHRTDENVLDKPVTHQHLCITKSQCIKDTHHKYQEGYVILYIVVKYIIFFSL